MFHKTKEYWLIEYVKIQGLSNNWLSVNCNKNSVGDYNKDYFLKYFLFKNILK